MLRLFRRRFTTPIGSLCPLTAAYIFTLAVPRMFPNCPHPTSNSFPSPSHMRSDFCDSAHFILLFYAQFILHISFSRVRSVVYRFGTMLLPASPRVVASFSHVLACTHLTPFVSHFLDSTCLFVHSGRCPFSLSHSICLPLFASPLLFSTPFPTLTSSGPTTIGTLLLGDGYASHL